MNPPADLYFAEQQFDIDSASTPFLIDAKTFVLLIYFVAM